MTHPDDLLADYVDGALPEGERAVVDAHVGSCTRCRDEIELARTALRALGALEDVEVPVGVTGPILREAGERGRRASAGPRSQWIAGLAAAAAIVAVVAISLGGPSGDGGLDAASEGTGAVEQQMSAAADIVLERQTAVNYDGEAGMRALATEAIRSYRSGPGGPEPRTDSAAPAAGNEEVGDAASAAPVAGEEGAGGAEAEFRAVDPAPALRCVRRAPVLEDPSTATLVRLIDARFEDAPAYLAVVLQTPGAGQPPDRAVVWALARGDCRVLNVSVLSFDSVD